MALPVLELPFEQENQFYGNVTKVYITVKIYLIYYLKNKIILLTR